MSHPRAPRWRTSGRLAAGLASLATLLTLAVLPSPASAATTTFTVDSLVHDNVAANTEDATPGDGTCATAGGTCTLTAALQEANALPASAGDDVKIVFADALGEATIEVPDNGIRMVANGLSPIAFSNTYLGDGYFYAIDAQRPVTIDFGGDISVESEGDANYGLFAVQSAGATIENFKNIRAGAGGITVAGSASNTTIRNGSCLDTESPISEVCIGLLSEAHDVAISDVTADDQYFFGIFVDRAEDGDDPVSNVAVTRFTGKNTSGYGDLWFELDAKVDGFTVTDSEFDSPGHYAVGIQSGADIANVSIEGSRFLAENSVAIWDHGNSKTTNLRVEDSLFQSTGWAFADNAGSEHDGFTFRGNTVDDTNGEALNLDQVEYTNAVIEGNTFTDARGNAPTIRIGREGTNDVVRGNTFTQAADTLQNRWAIYNAANPGVGESTGWSFIANDIDGVRGTVEAPIINHGNGTTRMERNTFGTDTEGSDDPNESERGARWFVANDAAEANHRIQTWRPTSAVFDGANVTISVAPVSPPLAGNNAPTAPVDVDVYWTADDNAEEYLGRLEGLTGAATRSLPTTHTGGSIRVQTQDADGNSSQYSAPVQIEEDTTPPAAPVISSIDDDGAVHGTGEPGAKVTVRDSNGKPVGTATVQSDGTWTFAGPVACGERYTATQEDAAGNVSPVSGSVTAKACPDRTPPTAPVISALGSDNALRGLGEPGARIRLVDQAGKLVGEAVVQPNGTWVIPGPLPCGQKLTAVQIDAAGNVSPASGAYATPACAKPPATGPTSEDALRLRCGEIPLALIDVRRGARNKKTKRYGKTTIVGVADAKYVGQRVAIRFLATNKIVGRAKVGADGRFRLLVNDQDQRNRQNVERRRFRAEIDGQRSVALKLTRRFDVTSVRVRGGTWTVRARATKPLVRNAKVTLRLLSTCGGDGWKDVASGRLDRNGRVSFKVPAPEAGSYQLVRLTTTVKTPNGKSSGRTYTTPRGSK